jgi:DNA recombination protein RmuC
MDILWGIGGLVIGASVALLLMRSRLAKAGTDIAAERQRADGIEVERQGIALELAAVRAEASRAVDLTTQALADSETIKNLEKQCSSLSATIEEREKGLINERALHEKRDAELKKQLTQLTDKTTADALSISDLEKEVAAMKASIEEREKNLAEERAQLASLRETLKAQFAELSANALKDNSEAFLNSAKKVLALQHLEADKDLEKRQDEIKQLVKPIQEGIKAVGDVAKEMESKREKAFGTIEEQLKQSILQAAEVARQTSGLKDALKKPNVRGRWGEVQLKNCIELAGMEEHCDVEFQVSSVSIEDDRIRPDMVVRMPGGRSIAVDSKTPMDAFLEYIEAATDDQRTVALVRHGKTVRNHIAGLVKSDYMQKVAKSPDFVVMFLPNESFLAMALDKEPSIIEDALSKKVLITTPGTLIGLLKVIRYGWNEQKIAVNAQQIADEGAKLNTEITRFLEDFAKLGIALKSATDAYDTSMRRVEKQITSTSTKLTNLGAKSRKALTHKATRMLATGDVEEEEEADEFLLEAPEV